MRRGPSRAGSFPIWAITQCPLIYRDWVIVASQAPEAGVVAYDKLTGQLKWKAPALGDVGYVSPAIVKIDGQDHVVMVTPSTNPFARSSPDENNPGRVIGIEPVTGKVLWEYHEWNCHVSVPSAVDAGAEGSARQGTGAKPRNTRPAEASGFASCRNTPRASLPRSASFPGDVASTEQQYRRQPGRGTGWNSCPSDFPAVPAKGG